MKRVFKEEVMKKILVFVLLLSVSVFSFSAKIAVVNSQKIMSEYSATKTATKFLSEEKNKLQKDIDAKSKELEKLFNDLKTKGDKRTKADEEKYLKQKTDFGIYYQAQQNKLEKLKYQEYSKIQSAIDTAIKQVAKKEKYDYVVEGKAVRVGGENLSGLGDDINKKVLKFLEKSEKIEL